MSRLGLAFRLFFRVLSDPAVAEQGEKLLDPAQGMLAQATRAQGTPAQATTALPPTAAAPSAPPAPTRPVEPQRSDALTLLEVLQREARLIDFLKENIAPFSDAQVGAAVRDVHRDAAAVLERLFAPRPVMSEPEGSTVSLSTAVDAGRIRLTGNVTATPRQGTLRHGGWKASKVEMPQWTGPRDTATIIAPAEVEV